MKELLTLSSRILNYSLTRRSALKALGIGSASLWLQSCHPFTKKSPSSASDVAKNLIGQEPLVTDQGKSFSPIDRTIAAKTPAKFSGDQPSRAHEILWKKDEFIQRLGRYPKPTEEAPLVVVGGGMSGLFSSFLLRNYRPIILEQAERFGGNAKGESWQGLDYLIGAAYFVRPEPGSQMDQFITALGFKESDFQISETGNDYVLNGRRYANFWSGASALEGARQFKKLHRHLTDVLQSKNGQVFPEIPYLDSQKGEHIRKLDRMSFRSYLRQVIGGVIHPYIETHMEHYCWSSLGAPSSELSAAAGLNFYSSELAEVCTLPGGNGTIAEKILHQLVKVIPNGNFRPSSLVFDVAADSTGVNVSYLNSSGEVQCIRAKSVILSCPKFVVGRILRGIESERLEAIRKLKYRSYVVANLLVDDVIEKPFFDLFMLSNGRTDASNIKAASQRHGVTDVLLTAHPDPSIKRTTLGLYLPLPYDGTRSHLLGPKSYDEFRALFEKQAQNEILPALGISPKKIADLRMARWGHSIPVASRGLIASGITERIRKPFDDRVFFVEQDNWMLPAFETCAAESMIWTPLVKRVLEA